MPRDAPLHAPLHVVLQNVHHASTRPGFFLRRGGGGGSADNPRSGGGIGGTPGGGEPAPACGDVDGTKPTSTLGIPFHHAEVQISEHLESPSGYKKISAENPQSAAVGTTN